MQTPSGITMQEWLTIK